jgi:hypothetical protein
MKLESVDNAVHIGYGLTQPEGVARRSSKCDFTAGIHAFLTALAKEAGFIEAIGLRAAAGAVTRVRRKLGCVS